MKFDIEYHEWDTLQTMLNDGTWQYLRQVATEFHINNGKKDPHDRPNIKSYKYMLSILDNFSKSGFRMWRTHLNAASTYKWEINDKKIYSCHEDYYINKSAVRGERLQVIE